jgi:dTDP-4-amino-4,6-dideoxygalactose transaminase
MLNEILYNLNNGKYLDAVPESECEQLSGSGYINLLERKLIAHYEKKFAITFTNATQAIFFLCLALNIKNNAILTSPLTWGGSIAPFLFFDNKILFSEFDLDNYCLNSQLVKKNVLTNCRALMSIDYCGNPADTKSLKNICDDRNLMLITDSSQSFGAYYGNKPAGYYSDIIIVSFGPGKPLYGGEGGAVITSNENLFESLIWLSQHPQRQKKLFGLSYLNQFGLNGRINSLGAKNIVVNWNMYLNKLKKTQFECFDNYRYLKSAGIIKPKKFLQTSSNSTFFFPIYELNSNISYAEAENTLRKKIPLKSPINYKIKLLNEDFYFIEKYSSLSRNLISKKFMREVKSRNFIYIK